MTHFAIAASGNTSPQAIEAAVRHLQSLGLQVTWLSKGEAAPDDPDTPLPDAMLVYDLLINADNSHEWRDAVLGVITTHNITTIASLRQVRITEFVTPGKDVFVRWQVKLLLLRWMIRHRLAFHEDVTPVDIFVTQVTRVFYDNDNVMHVRIRAALERNNLPWLELLGYMTKMDVRDLPNLGHKSVDIIEACASHHGVSFLDSQ